jgi:hypothetical protein
MQLVNGAAPAEPTQDAPAVAQPSSADGVASAQTSANAGAAPTTTETPYQRRKRVERERAAEAEKRKADRAAKRAAKGAAPAQAAKPTEQTDDEWDEDQRRRETGGFWRLTLRLVSLALWPFGYRLDALTDKECAEDVALLAPLAGRHKWLELLIRYAALPYLLAERIATKFRKREPEKPAGKAEAPRS